MRIERVESKREGNRVYSTCLPTGWGTTLYSALPACVGVRVTAAVWQGLHQARRAKPAASLKRSLLERSQ